MQKYLVVYSAEEKIEMDEQEVRNFITELKTQDVVEFKGELLTRFFKVIVKKRSEFGRLWDGTRVILQFGIWRDATDPTLKLDPNYYPEIASDTVMEESVYLEKEAQKKLGQTTG